MFAWIFETEHTAMLFHLMKTRPLFVNKKSGPFSHKVHLNPSMSVPRDTISAGFSSIDT